jgi:hypothetical protein
VAQYPSDMRRILVHIESASGREHMRLFDVPPEWATWPHAHRQTWASDRCAEAAAALMTVTWSDPDEVLDPMAFPTSYEAESGDVVE